MGQYVANTFADDDAINAAALNAEFAAIETANNSVSNGDIPADEIDWTKFTNMKDNFALQLRYYHATVPNAQTDLWCSQVPIPCDCTLLSVKVTRSANADVASIDIFQENAGPAATILTGAITLATGDAISTVYSGSIATSSFSEGDVLSLRATTNGGGTIDDIDVTLYFEAAHVSP
ncbi:MAG: hypothetical protein R6U98_06575 [Pirellulaceae bacterium]